MDFVVPVDDKVTERLFAAFGRFVTTPVELKDGSFDIPPPVFVPATEKDIVEYLINVLKTKTLEVETEVVAQSKREEVGKEVWVITKASPKTEPSVDVLPK